MSIKVTILSPELERQIQQIKNSDRVLEKHFRPVFQKIVETLEGRIRPMIPVKTGRARNTFGSRVVGSGLKLSGQVGWWAKDGPFYINVVEHGARAHPLAKGKNIRSKARAAAFSKRISNPNRKVSAGTHVYIDGKWVTMEYHPGFSKRGFMAAGYSATKPMIDRLLEDTLEKVVEELGIKL